MGRFRFDATVRWKRGQERGKQGNIPIENFAAGNGVSHAPSQSGDRAEDLPQLQFVVESINEWQTFTIWLRAPYANMYLRPYWELDSLRLGMYEGNRYVYSVECRWPKRKLSVLDKGLQRVTFLMQGASQFDPSVP